MLKENEHFSASLLENAPNPILVFNKDTSVRYVNPSMEEMTGFTRKEIIGRKPPFPWLRTGQLEKTAMNIQQTTISRLNKVERLFEKKNGEHFWVEVSHASIKNNGEVWYHLENWVDISERKKIEAALHESEEFNTSLLENMPNPVVVLTQDTTIKYVNPTLEKLTGFLLEEVIGKRPPFPWWQPQQLERHSQHLQQLTIAGSDKTEILFRNKNGELFWVVASSTNINKDGKLKYHLANWVDITERKKAEAALRESEARYRTLFESAVEGILIVDSETRKFKYANPTICTMLGYSREELTKVGITDIHPTASLEHVLTELEAQTRREKTLSIDLPCLKKDGTIIYADINGIEATIDGRACMIGFFIDVTKRKQAEEELRHSREQLHQYSTYLQGSIETEKKRLASEIHDELGQMLTALKIDLSWITKRLPADSEPLIQKSKVMQEMIDTTDKVLLRMSADLRPVLLDDLGLSVAVPWLVEQFKNRTGIECELVLVPDDISLDQDRSLAVFRIVQESLTNITRHANATKVGVSLILEAGNLAMEIRDNGRGITNNEIAGVQSFGLIGIRERAQHWGGDLSISGVHGKGTAILVNIPVSEDKNG